MILENVKPLLIVWLPVTSPDDISRLDFSTDLGNSFMNDAVDFVTRRTKENRYLITSIPIPFYFYERLSNDKDSSDDVTGFMLDSVEENIDLSYPETPTANTLGNTKAAILTIRNTIDVSFRVKMNSTIVSVLRLLMKRVLTDYDTAKYIKFSFYWNEYALSDCKIIDYNEAAVTGTDLTVLKIKLESFQPGEENSTDQASQGQFSPADYFNRP